MKNKLLLFLTAVFLLGLISSVNAGVTDISLITPAVIWTNGTNSTVGFTFNYTSNSSESGNATLYLQDAVGGVHVVSRTNFTASNLTNTFYSNHSFLGGNNGNMTWYVNITDGENESMSEIRNLYVLRTAPTVTITRYDHDAVNNNFTSDTTLLVNYTLLVPGWSTGAPVRNCSVYLSGTVYGFNNTAAGYNNNSQNSIRTSTLTEGNRSIQVNCTTQSDIVGASTLLYILLDTSAPNVTITYPSDQYGNTLTSGSFAPNVTVTDATDPVMTCLIYISTGASNTSITVSNGSTFSSTWELPDGGYSVYAVCNDTVGHSTTSSTTYFNIKIPVTGEGTVLGCTASDGNPITKQCCPLNKPRYSEALYVCVADPTYTPPASAVTTTTTTVKSQGGLIPPISDNDKKWGILGFIIICCIAFYLAQKYGYID